MDAATADMMSALDKPSPECQAKLQACEKEHQRGNALQPAPFTDTLVEANASVYTAPYKSRQGMLQAMMSTRKLLDSMKGGGEEVPLMADDGGEEFWDPRGAGLGTWRRHPEAGEPSRARWRAGLG